MRVILSHPYSGALHWWMNGGDDHASHLRGHPYYDHLYTKASVNVDLALAFTVVFDEIVIAAADNLYPGAEKSSDYRHVKIPSLKIEADWNATREALDIMGDGGQGFSDDPVLGAILRSVPRRVHDAVLADAISDAILMRDYAVSIVSSQGRLAMVQRLIEMGALSEAGISPSDSLATNSMGPKASPTSTDQLAKYVDVTGLTFNSNDVGSLSELKNNTDIRKYSGHFQEVLIQTERNKPDLYESMQRAARNKKIENKVAGGFTAATRALSVASLIPAVGTVTGIVGLGTDAASEASKKLAKGQSWYELGPKILELQSKQALERFLANPESS